METLINALAELDADDLDAMATEFFNRTEFCLESDRHGWAKVYACIAVAAITALESVTCGAN